MRSQVLKTEADYGYCAAKREYYYGLKAHLLIDLRGVAVGVTITPANADERDAAHDSQLEQRFGPAQIRARDAGHLTHQATRTLLAHTVGVWLNLRQDREPLDLDGLLAA